MYAILFTDVACGDGDYKDWTPTHHLYGSQNCLLGQHLVYERRLAHAYCYNGRDYDREISVNNCTCTIEDYEWSVYWRVVSKSTMFDCMVTICKIIATPKTLISVFHL